MKEQFPLFEAHPSFVYLDSAATTQKPQCVIEAMSRFLTKEYGTVHRAVYRLAAQATSHYDAVREKVQRLLHAKEKEEIIFTRGTTDGINLVASCFGRAFVQKGDEILITETEHHSNIVPWQMLCQEFGAKLRVIPVDDNGEISLEIVESMLSSSVKLVAIAHIANATGIMHPIKEVISLAHKVGAKVLVDAAQSISHYPINVQELDVDFLVFSGHKGYGPTGIGVLYGKRALLEAMPPYQGGGDMIRQVSFEGTTYQEIPLKFEAGTPSITEVIGLGAAIDFLQDVGFETISALDHDLLSYAVDSLSLIPQVKLLCKEGHKASMVSFTCEGCHPLDVGMLLDARGIAVRTGHLCAQPALARLGHTSVIRISFGLYNTRKDIDFLCKALQEVLLILTV